MIKDLPAVAGDPGSFPGLGRSPGERTSNPLQCSCQGNSMDTTEQLALSLPLLNQP